MRKAGILLHISSLPGAYGIGTMGKEAFNFIDFLKSSGQKAWQVLPLHPTGFGNSPYQSPSVFAGNPLLIDLDTLAEDSLLLKSELLGIKWGGSPDSVDFESVKSIKYELLLKAYTRFIGGAKFDKFCSENAFWLDSYALFMSVKEEFGFAPWYMWDDDIKDYSPEAVIKYSRLLQDKIGYYKFEQFMFFSQWQKLRSYSSENGIEIIGDIPIYVALDSADVWTRRSLFSLTQDGSPEEVAGCPPDAFSEDGQLWGNPLYDWDVMKKDGYSWWISRIASGMRLYDTIRIDHFRGFAGYYAIPYGDETAKNGKWKKGPGIDLFNAIKSALPSAQIIAEDLGFLTADVYELLDSCDFPGMKVLQFAFDPYNDNPYLPHNYTENCVAYTGTHDNDTTEGWFENEGNKSFIMDYLNVTEPSCVPEAMVRAVLSSCAKLAVIPMQDYLTGGVRMNTPSTVNDKNWAWRVDGSLLSDSLSQKILHLTKLYKR